MRERAVRFRWGQAQAQAQAKAQTQTQAQEVHRLRHRHRSRFCCGVVFDGGIRDRRSVACWRRGRRGSRSPSSTRETSPLTCCRSPRTIELRDTLLGMQASDRVGSGRFGFGRVRSGWSCAGLGACRPHCDRPSHLGACVTDRGPTIGGVSDIVACVRRPLTK